MAMRPTKRKRETAREHEPRKNPFLSALEGSGSAVRQDDTYSLRLQHFLRFEEYSTKRTGDETADLDGEAALAFLVDFVESSSTASMEKVDNSDAISPSDISLLILPWSIKRILSSTSRSEGPGISVWRATHAALVCLVKSEDASVKYALSQQILTQSTLYKLSPKAALFAILKSEERDSSTITEETVSERSLAASVFRVLTDKLFRPTLDVACKLLLIPIAQNLPSMNKLDDEEASGTVDIDVLRATVRLLLFLHHSRKGNAKTSFQLFSSRQTLLALAKVYLFFQSETETLSLEKSQENNAKDMILDLLSDVLFNPKHHIDGFLSLLHNADLPHFTAENEPANNNNIQKRTDFRCYQENLLVTIDNILTVPMEQHDEEQDDTLTGLHFVPILVRCFLEQTLRWEGQGMKKGSPGELRSILQFHLFACWAVRLQRIVSDNVSPDYTATAIRSLREMLELILQHDTYNPSQGKESDSQFGFLATMAGQILELPVVSHVGVSVLLLKNAIPMVGLFLRLNHLILHEKMKESLLFCTQDGSSTLGSLVADVLVVFFNTYRKLRQQNFAFNTVLAVLDAEFDQRDACPIRFLGTLLQDHSVSSSIALAVRTCPTQQVEEVFETLESWLRKRSSVLHLDAEPSTAAFGAALNLVELATRNVRVDRATSGAVSDICRKFVKGALSSLAERFSMEEGKNLRATGKFENRSFKLCAWILELHERCRFWLGRGTHLVVPKSILLFLERQLSGIPEALHALHFTEGVVLLSCHRLRQLQAEIHEQERLELDGQTEGASKPTLLSDAKVLAKSLGIVAIQENVSSRSGRRSGWSVVAESFRFWVDYAEEGHMIEFLKWMCTALANSSADKMRREASGESEIAKALLSDASFFEEPRVQCYFSRVLLSSTLGFLVEAVRKSSDRGVLSILQKVSTPTESAENIFLPLSRTAIALSGLSEQSRDEVKNGMEKASELVLVFAALPLTESGFSSTEAVRLGCKLDYAFRCLLLTASDENESRRAVHAITNLRLYLSMAAKTCCRSSVYHDSDRQVHSALVGGVLEVNADLATESYIQNDASRFYFSTGRLIQSFIEILLSSGNSLGLSKTIAKLANQGTSVHRLDALAYFGSDIVEGMSRYRVARTPKQDAQLSPLVESLWCLVERHPVTHNFDILGPMLLASRLLRWGFRPTVGSEIEKRIETLCMKVFESNEEDAKKTCCSILGSLVPLETSKSTRNRIIDLAINADDHRLDATFGTLARALPDSELKPLLEKLLTDETSRQASPLRLIMILFHYLHDEGQVKVLSEFGLRMLSCALYRLRSSDSSSIIDAALKVMDVLINRRDIVILREFDLGIVLSHMSEILAGTNPPEVSTGLLSSTFALCCTLLNSMHQRYSKLLYACAPSVILVYSAMLRHAMYGPECAEQPRQLARVCELLVPHRDIYKKHVLGLVLDYVHALDTMTLERRDCLIPAVYFILDIMSTYEMQQLNASMDTERRMLFRTIYQGYQKVHAYKGQ